MTEDDISMILSNPFYCLRKVKGEFCEEHETVVSEEHFVRCAVQLIKDIGPEEFVKKLLDNLRA